MNHGGEHVLFYIEGEKVASVILLPRDLENRVKSCLETRHRLLCYSIEIVLKEKELIPSQAVRRK